jgi:hypothetical protein
LVHEFQVLHGRALRSLPRSTPVAIEAIHQPLGRAPYESSPKLSFPSPSNVGGPSCLARYRARVTISRIVNDCPVFARSRARCSLSVASTIDCSYVVGVRACKRVALVCRLTYLYQMFVSCSKHFAQRHALCSIARDCLFVVCSLRCNLIDGSRGATVPQNSMAGARAVPLAKFCEISKGMAFCSCALLVLK